MILPPSSAAKSAPSDRSQRSATPRALSQAPDGPPPAPAAEAAVSTPPAPEFSLERVNAGQDIRPLRETTIDLRPTTAVPENPAGNVYAGTVDLRHRMGWMASVETGHTASVQFHPLYFEEINLERYGYHFGCLQPAVSAVRFYGSLPLLPYKLADRPPCSYESNLAHPAAATAAPPVRCRPKRPNMKAAVFQAGVMAGAFLLIP
jgi:hypothetical protein